MRLQKHVCSLTVALSGKFHPETIVCPPPSSLPPFSTQAPAHPLLASAILSPGNSLRRLAAEWSKGSAAFKGIKHPEAMNFSEAENSMWLEELEKLPGLRKDPTRDSRVLLGG